MRQHVIVVNNLETRTLALKDEGKTLDQIAKILTEESNISISPFSVRRYLESNKKYMVQAIEKSDKLKAQLAETEINTINERLADIHFLLDLAEQARNEGDLRVSVLSMRARTEALNCLDQRLGALHPAPTNNTINIVNMEAVNNARELITSRIACLSSRVGEGSYPQ